MEQDERMTSVGRTIGKSDLAKKAQGTGIRPWVIRKSKVTQEVLHSFLFSRFGIYPYVRDILRIVRR